MSSRLSEPAPSIGPVTDALLASDDPFAAVCWLPWEVGAGAEMYAVAHDSRRYVGAMTTRDLAKEVVDGHNATLREAQK